MRWAGLVVFVLLPVLQAENANFAGVLVGISTLAADGTSQVGSDSTNISLYKPENGWTALALAGRHLNDFWSIEASYGWNRNMLTLTASHASPDELVFYEQQRRATMHRVLGELLFYVRNRRSRARPYLSVGGGVVYLRSGAGGIGRLVDGGLAAPSAFSAAHPALQVAVGVDIQVGGGWDFRFTFAETINANEISKQLAPAASRNLANFQNAFGFVKRF
jgi:hypothetical protein